MSRKSLFKFPLFIHQIIIRNHLITSIFGMVLYAIFSVLPICLVQYYPTVYSSTFYVNIPQGMQISSESRIWLQLVTFSSIPAAIDFCLDIPTYYKSTELRLFATYRLILMLALLFPTIVAYDMLPSDLNNTDQDTLFTYTITMHQLLALRSMLVMSSILCIMFCTPVKTIDKQYAKLRAFSADYTMYFILLSSLSRILRVVRFLLHISPGYDVLSILGWGFDHGSDVLLIYLVANLIIYHLKHNDVRKLESHHQLGDYLYSLTLIVYAVGETVALGAADFTRTEDNIGDAVLYWCLFLSISVSFIVTVIPGRCHIRHAEIKEEKLQNRLNLIRYVSHEMRTPLNTAIMGTQLSLDDAGTLEKKCAIIKQYLTASPSTATPASATDARSANSDCLQALDEMKGTLSDVCASCHLAVQTLDDLLMFDKIDEDKLVLDMGGSSGRINPWQLVRDTAAPFAINAQVSGVQFAVDCEGPSLWTESVLLRGDAFKLAQVLRNLISNALK